MYLVSIGLLATLDCVPSLEHSGSSSFIHNYHRKSIKPETNKKQVNQTPLVSRIYDQNFII